LKAKYTLHFKCTQLVQADLQRYFDEREGDARVLAHNPSVYRNLKVLNEQGDEESVVHNEQMQGHADELRQVISTAMDAYEYSFIFATDVDGNIVAGSDEEYIGVNFGERDYIQQALGGNLAWSDMFYSDIVHQNSMIVSKPVRSEGDSGEVVGSFSLMFVQQDIDAIVHEAIEGYWDTGNAYLVDEDGLLLSNTVIGEFNEDAALNETIESGVGTAAAEHIGDGNTDYFAQDEYTNYMGNSVLGTVGVTNLGNLPVGLVVELDHDQIMGTVEGARGRIILYMIIGSILIIGFGSWVGKNMSAPIVQVKDQLAELADGGGDLTRELEINRTD